MALDPNQPQQTPQMRALQALSNQLPVANSRIAQGQNAARQMQIQQAVQSAPTAAPTTQTAQQTGAAAAGQAADQSVQQAQKGIAQQGQIGQLGVQEQARQGQAAVASQQMGAAQEKQDMATQFAQLDAGLKQKLYDNTMKFQVDELGRTKFNDIQLADYARTQAQNEEQYRNYAQVADQASQRKLEMMTVAYKKLTEDLDARYATAKAKGDFETQKQIQQAKFDAEQQMDREKNRAANNSAIWSSGGTVAGVAAGAVLGSAAGPAGTAAGAAAGGMLGGAIGGAIGGTTR